MGFSEFIESAEESRKIAFSFKDPLIVHHYDADGISAGAIVKIAFLKKNKSHRICGIKKLDDTEIEKLKQEKEIIFVDLGNNERTSELQDVLIIDHHQLRETKKPQINPLMHEIDGGTELSASGTAYFTFGNNPDLGLVGALGDMQYPLQGANKILCEQGIANGEIVKSIDLKFYGRYSRPLIQFLAYSEEPLIHGISFNEPRTQQFLEDLKIALKKGDEYRTYDDLNYEEKKKLISGIAVLVSERGRKELIGEVYDLPKRPRKSALYDAHEFSTVLNACGRHGKPELGIAICLGEEAAYLEGAGFLALHKRMLREGLEYAKSGLVDLGAFWFLDGRGIIDEGIIGIVCGMILQYESKPIIGIANSAQGIKISSRVSKRSKINLGKALIYTAEKVHGVGGGHAVAAGANIPKEKLNEFLLILKENIMAQTV